MYPCIHMYIKCIFYVYLTCLLDSECNEECIDFTIIFFFFTNFFFEGIWVRSSVFFLPGVQNTEIRP